MSRAKIRAFVAGLTRRQLECMVVENSIASLQDCPPEFPELVDMLYEGVLGIKEQSEDFLQKRVVEDLYDFFKGVKYSESELLEYADDSIKAGTFWLGDKKRKKSKSKKEER